MTRICFLTAAHSVSIPALCLGQIPHDYTVREERLWVVRVPGVLVDRSLLVDQGPVWASSTKLCTQVFNLSASEQIIHKGESVSMLVRI